MYIDQPDEVFDQFMETDYIGVKWFDDRIMDSGHLIGGPLIGFFRSGDKLKIIWDSVRQSYIKMLSEVGGYRETKY